MNVVLSPDRPQVNQGAVLSLVIRTDDDSIGYKQFIVLRPFNYADFMDEIRVDGYVKTDEVFLRLSQRLEQEKYVQPIEAYILDVGKQGRASKALKECYQYSLNHDGCEVMNLIKVLEKRHFCFDGPEGTLHLLKTEVGETLGLVTIMIETDTGIQRRCVLDVIGPRDSDFPTDFRSEIEHELKTYLLQAYPDLNFTLTARVQRSELSIGSGTLLEYS